MCGIVGVVHYEGQGLTNDDLLAHLKRLEYRGYDSCGFATEHGVSGKAVGKITDFMHRNQNEYFNAAISHTRWATHGGVTTTNSHPHFNESRTIMVVHNGIIENYRELRHRLEERGYVFDTETDTEVIPHYFDYKKHQGLTPEQTIQDFFKEIEGTYAVLLMFKDNPTIYAFKKDSPLVLGWGKDRAIIASSAFAFGDKATQAQYFDDKTYAVISESKFGFYDHIGNEIVPNPVPVEYQEDEEIGEYPHFMLKEINEQPRVANRLLRSLATEQLAEVGQLAEAFKRTKRVVFVACGTSYHASLIGGSILSRLGYSVHNIIASEFDTFYKVDEDTLVVAISQSGETMDVVTVLQDALSRGATVASLVNVPHSTIQRQSHISIDIVAGQEVAVASTKAFTNQVLVLLYLAKQLGADINIEEVPKNLERTIQVNDSRAQQFAEEIATNRTVFFLGRGYSYPVAREMALKLKEISYIHAEGTMAGELKHGSLALIDPDEQTPTICLIPNNDARMISSAQEVAARGAKVIKVSNTNGDFPLPPSENVDFALYAVVVGQLLAYHTAVIKGCDVDQPRNLAKSVTVH